VRRCSRNLVPHASPFDRGWFSKKFSFSVLKSWSDFILLTILTKEEIIAKHRALTDDEILTKHHHRTEIQRAAAKANYRSKRKPSSVNWNSMIMLIFELLIFIFSRFHWFLKVLKNNFSFHSLWAFPFSVFWYSLWSCFLWSVHILCYIPVDILCIFEFSDSFGGKFWISFFI